MKTLTLTLISLVSASASIVGLHNTGIDSGFGADANYNLAAMPKGAPYSTVPRIIYNADSIVPASGNAPWLSNGGGSAWIGPADQETGTVILPGIYLYVTGFTITESADFTNIHGWWAADGYGSDILVNGISTGLRTTVPTPGVTAGSYTAFTAFEISANNCAGCFRLGYNTIAFQVANGSMESGLRVRFADPTIPNPEPATFGLVGLALAAAGGLKRRKVR